MLSIFEFNKILIIKIPDSIFLRLLFLILISNGFLVFKMFSYLQPKFIVLFLFLLFLRREIEYRDLNKYNKNNRFLFIQYSILIFATGMIPPFLLIIPIYLFHDMKIKDIFKRANLTVYSIIILAFCIQNFLFFIFPELIFGFVNGYSRIGIPKFYCFMLITSHLTGWETSFAIISVISLVIFSFLLINLKNNIEEKFCYFCIFYIFMSVYLRHSHFIVIVPLISIILMKDIKIDSFYSFIKENIHFLIGIFCLFLLLNIPNHTWLQSFSFYNIQFESFLIILSIVYFILVISIIIEVRSIQYIT